MERFATRGGNARAFFNGISKPITLSFARLFFQRTFSAASGFLTLIAFSIASPVFAVTSSVGATPGAFTVNPSGAATYSIPIAIPPGTNGMTPKLSLNYNSQAGNGLVGVGWSIGGLSVIHRCGATIYLDGFKGGVNYDTNDRFCLDGERLISIGNNEYRTQHESWRRVIAVGGTASDPGYFKVTTKDGVVHYYGATADARIEAQGKTVARLWALSKIQDRDGNYLTVTYQEENAYGDYRPDRIDYTGNGSTAPYNSVVFGYVEPQASRPDIVPLYEGESVIKTLKRLTHVTSYASAQLVREYRLTYDNNGAAKRSRMISLQECGTDEVCLPSTNLMWTPVPTSLLGASVNTGVEAGDPFLRLITSADINGDGRDDLVWERLTSSYYIFSSSALPGTSGFAPAINSGIGSVGLPPWIFSMGDINGDGMSDLEEALWGGGTGTIFYSLTASSGLQPVINTGIQTGTYAKQSLLADIDGDGRADLVFLSGPAAAGPYDFYYAFSTGAGFGLLNGRSAGAVTSITPADFDGDGRSDMLCVQSGGVSYFNYTLSTGASGWNPCASNGLSGQPSAGPWPADINGDGKSDLVWIENGSIYYAFSTGTGFTSATNTHVSVAPVAAGNATVADINGDGLPDVAWMGNDGYIHYSLANGSGFDPAINSYVTAPISFGPWAVDFNGDGKQDLVWLYNGIVFSSLAQSESIDLLQSVTDGLNVETTVSYKPLTDSTVYTKDSGSVYPYQDVQNATYVVSSYSQSNGVGGRNTTSYQYAGLKKHFTANTSLGFHKMTATDPTGLEHVTYFNQNLNGTEGTALSTETWFGNVLIKYLDNTWAPIALANGRTLAQLMRTREDTREVNGNSVVTTITNYSNYDAYGHPGTIFVDFNDGWKRYTTNTYEPDITNWALDKLTYSKVEAYAPGQYMQYRESRFEYDPIVPGRLTKEIIEPNRSLIALTTVYSYDLFGNRTKKTVSGPDIATRDEYTLTFDPRGQFVTSKTNALGHKEIYNSYDPRNGAVISLTDANGLPFTWEYNDSFARKTLERRPDQTWTTYTYSGCDTTCPPFAVTMTGSATSGAGTTWVYRDMLWRNVRQQTQGFGGNWIYQDTAYDNLGRVASVSHPYYSGETLHYVTYTYDSLGRVLTTTAPSSRITTTTYNGLTTDVTFTAPNTPTQTKSSVKNSQGQVVNSTDAAGTTSYQYDPFGNLTQVTDVAGNVTVMGYDIRGRKITMNDPNMGAWLYTYNALSQLKKQVDAKGQTTSMAYDKLGRMTQRSTAEGLSYWTYDTAAYGKGKLAAMGNSTATKTYAYDNLGRLATANTGIGGATYTVTNTYDAYSRVDTIAYPETGFTLRHCYDGYSHLTRIESATNVSPCSDTLPAYWIATAADAHGRLTSETYGNGLISQHVYDHDTNDLQTIQTGSAANPSSVQNLYYTFDALGNLSSRADYINNFTELLGYDSVNRLTSVSGYNAVSKTYDYYPNGNIKYKSDVGNYTYPSNGVQPHAVTAVAGVLNATFTYDANGNMLTGNGRTMTYTSFNKPKTIVKGGATDSFTYDANFNRVNKTTSTSATTYIGKLYERVLSGTLVTQNHFLYAGNNLVGMYTKWSNGLSSTRYYHTDHLGSVDTITSETGAVSARYGYDAHGRRRYANGTDAPLGTNLTGQRRGYTRHEHDDEVALINMNAREYDPLVGRFLTPDTLVPGVLNSQSFNRYSYVNNNPLSFTDPTGHGWNPFRSVSKAVKSVVNAHKRYIDWHQRAVEKAKDSQAVRMAAAAVAAYYTAGGASSWFTSWVSESAFATSAFASESYAYAYGVQSAIVIGGGIVGGAAAGATAGGILCGSDCARQSAKGGAVSGGIFAGANLISQDWNRFGEITARASASGLSAQYQGGNFSNGFQTGFITGAGAWGYEQIVRYGATWQPGGAAVPKNSLDMPVASGNNIGTTMEKIDINSWFGEGGIVSRALNVVPGINAVAGMHDVFQRNLEIAGTTLCGGSGWCGIGMREGLNVPGMPIAAVMALPALADPLLPYGYLSDLK